MNKEVTHNNRQFTDISYVTGHTHRAVSHTRQQQYKEMYNLKLMVVQRQGCNIANLVIPNYKHKGKPSHCQLRQIEPSKMHIHIK